MSSNLKFYSEDGNWYKGNLHTHTNVFDGLKPAKEVVKIYKDNNYNFLCITDHNIFSAYPEFNDDNFVMLNGVELTAGMQIDFDDFQKKMADFSKNGEVSQEEIIGVISNTYISKDFVMNRVPHLLAIAKNKDMDWVGFDSSNYNDIQVMIDLAKEHNCLAILAHPSWSKLGSNDILDLKGLDALEVYNHVCEAYFGGGIGEYHLDEMAHSGIKIKGVATDDMHNPDYACGAYIMVKSKELKYEAIVDAIEKGKYYSTTGPEIKDISIDGKNVTVKCSNAKSVRFVTDTILGRTYTDENNKMNECAHTLFGREKYVRIEVIDKDNNKAWSNPIYL